MVNQTRVDVRRYTPADTEPLIALFRNTVRTVNAADYTPEQLEVWAPDVIDLNAWHARLGENATFVAECGDRLAGFAELTPDGAVHMLYVDVRVQRRGVASALLEKLEAKARARGDVRLSTYASLTAKGFFACKGFRVLRLNQVERDGIVLTNYLMEKELTTPHVR